MAASVGEGVASLHVAGKADLAVPLASSLSLSRRFQSPIFLEHDQGHCIPMKANFLERYVAFVQSHLETYEASILANSHSESLSILPLSTQEKAAEQSVFVCASKEIASAQSDEMEVLLSIYPNEVTVLTAAPQAENDLCGRVLVRLPPNHTLPSESSSATVIFRIMSQLSLTFQFTSFYPEEMLPIVTIHRGDLSSTEFSDNFEREMALMLVYSYSLNLIV